jgi:hypothetical protein
MAKRKKKSSGVDCGMPSSDSGRISVSIQPAENGSVIELSHEGKDGYKRKTLVANSHNRAIRLAAQHLRSVGAKGKAKHKKSRHKVSASKSL